ncbi:MAG TPA: class I SAM-dependent methyltransferase [Candidatus Sulfotelmatobacter sp.]|nr:class I SAM-dependent methyltransferase [Candidatus Sulfotelmatobacter sp.]
MNNRERHGRASLEAIVENGDLGLPILHPGGLDGTRALAELCHVRSGKLVLDVASGTGESACYLAEVFGCKVTGIDHSSWMVETAKRKAEERGLVVEFENGDAHDLPFDTETFDLAISECATCALQKEKAITEMVRVVRRGGYVAISDLYWRDGAPEGLKSKLVELENERPETLAGWVHLFEGVGLKEVKTEDMPGAIATMTRDVRKQLGVLGQLKIMLRIIKCWGIWPIGRILATERIFSCKHLGYAIIVGRKAM